MASSGLTGGDACTTMASGGLAGGDAYATMAINFGARNIAGFAGDARRFGKHTTKESN